MARGTSTHILTTSSNLLGFCLIVMTSLRIANRTEATFIDELTAVAALLLMVSCILSFLSIRTEHASREDKLEFAADIFFLGGLSMVFITIVLIAFQFLL